MQLRRTQTLQTDFDRFRDCNLPGLGFHMFQIWQANTKKKKKTVDEEKK